MAHPNGHSKAERVSNKVGKMDTGRGRSDEEVRRMESRVRVIRRVMRSIMAMGHILEEISKSATAGPGRALFLSASFCYNNIGEMPRNLTLIYIH